VSNIQQEEEDIDSNIQDNEEEIGPVDVEEDGIELHIIDN